MDIIAVNGQEISLGCFVNLHKKTACVYIGIFAKISNYYVTITYGLWQLMHFNDLHLSVHNYPSRSDWIPGIIWN